MANLIILGCLCFSLKWLLHHSKMMLSVRDVLCEGNAELVKFKETSPKI